ncbi:MAG: hypothetical protein A07HB70_00933 [uncultured archaeon A07HB70]|nr:MAG: hypothetical protein A07HB70_00933 [uncultured archaeon A07HB70]
MIACCSTVRSSCANAIDFQPRKPTSAKTAVDAYVLSIQPAPRRRVDNGVVHRNRWYDGSPLELGVRLRSPPTGHVAGGRSAAVTASTGGRRDTTAASTSLSTEPSRCRQLRRSAPICGCRKRRAGVSLRRLSDGLTPVSGHAHGPEPARVRTRRRCRDARARRGRVGVRSAGSTGPLNDGALSPTFKPSCVVVYCPITGV